MAFATLIMENPFTGKIKEAPVGFSWTTLFFGFFVALFRGDFKWAVIQFLLAILSFGFSGLVFMFIYNQLFIKDLVGAGYKVKRLFDADMERVKLKLQMDLPMLEPTQSFQTSSSAPPPLHTPIITDDYDDEEENFDFLEEFITIRFNYVSGSGRTSEREVDVMEQYFDEYIRGHCHTADDERTFKVSRIEGDVFDVEAEKWMTLSNFKRGLITGEFEYIEPKPKEEKKQKIINYGVPRRKRDIFTFEVCFTGFPNDKRLELEREATQNGLMVRTGVTKKLDYLCAGPNAGWKKVEKAKEQGVPIINTRQFRELIEDGLSPEPTAIDD